MEKINDMEFNNDLERENKFKEIVSKHIKTLNLEKPNYENKEMFYTKEEMDRFNNIVLKTNEEKKQKEIARNDKNYKKNKENKSKKNKKYVQIDDYVEGSSKNEIKKQKDKEC
ncbi:hypothetical protein CWI38_1805p0010, partial [Hamiltosporidium tvaerminnensis]